MIDEEATFERYGYHSYDLKPKSDRKVIAVCDNCARVKVLRKSHYRALCRSCCKKGERSPVFGKKGENSHSWKGGKVKRICKQCGKEFPVAPSAIKFGSGKFCTRKCQGKWQSKYRKGKNNVNWKNGVSFEPYCSKFNNEFKEYIRDKFLRICFLCGKTEEENGRRLSVHHCNENKNCGCDGDATCQFVPLCKNCHAKVHSKKADWETKIKAKMRTKLNGWYI